MDKIQKLYEEIKGLEFIVKMYYDTKREISELEESIESLKQTKKSLDLNSIVEEIGNLEENLQEINREIECRNLLENSCLNIKDLKTILTSVTDSSTCQQKCLDFAKNLIVTFNISNGKAFEIFKIRKEEEFFTVLKMSREIEDLLQMIEGRSFQQTVTSEIQNALKLELTNTVPFDIICYTSESSIFLLYPSIEEENDEFLVKNIKETELSSIYSKFPKTFALIIPILKKNLARNLIEDQYTIEDVIINSNQLNETPFHILDVNEWVLDLIMKEIISISKSPIDTENLIEIEDQVSGKFISEKYSEILKLNRMLNICESKRKAKATGMFNKCILSYFNHSRCIYLKDLFLLYSELSHFIKRNENIENIEQLNNMREEIFYKILRESTLLEIDLDLSTLMLKAKIKQKQFDFEELLASFVSEKTHKFFKIQFFEKLYKNFIDLVLKPRKLNERERLSLKELSQYLMDISYEIDSSLISNFGKIFSICKVLDSSLSSVIDLYENDELDLMKSEIRALVRIVFDDSNLRENFLEQLM